MLKADLHLHTGEDREDINIAYTARELIARAAALGFEVLAITNHCASFYSRDLADYAAARGVLLISGVEARIEQKHVVLLNVGAEAEEISTFSQLREYKKLHPDCFVLAPHPYYPKYKCLNNKLLEHLDLFDGIEYCYFYFSFYNPYNKRAVELAQARSLPLLGSSDAHSLRQLGMTYSLLDADKNLASVLAALRANKITIVTRPLSAWQFIIILIRFTISDFLKICRKIGKKREGIVKK